MQISSDLHLQFLVYTPRVGRISYGMGGMGGVCSTYGCTLETYRCKRVQVRHTYTCGTSTLSKDVLYITFIYYKSYFLYLS